MYGGAPSSSRFDVAARPRMRGDAAEKEETDAADDLDDATAASSTRPHQRPRNAPTINAMHRDRPEGSSGEGSLSEIVLANASRARGGTGATSDDEPEEERHRARKKHHAKKHEKMHPEKRRDVDLV